MFEFVSVAAGPLLLGRLLYLAATLFLTTDVQAWSNGLLRVERRAIRWLAWVTLDAEGRAHAERMRERMKRGLPPF